MIRVPETTAYHAHIWWTRSKHQTLAGPLRYQRCACGLWRVMVVTGIDEVEAGRTSSPSATGRGPAVGTTVAPEPTGSRSAPRAFGRSGRD